MMRALASALLLPLLLVHPATAQDRREAPEIPKPEFRIGEVSRENWVVIDPDYLLVMDLAPALDGSERRVVIQLMEPPLATGWTGNIQRLARTGYWDGSSINRVQENFVVQWGQPDEGTLGTYKPLPAGLTTVPASEYTFGDLLSIPDQSGRPLFDQKLADSMAFNAILAARGEVDLSKDVDFDDALADLSDLGDRYAPFTTFAHGWPLGGSAARMATISGRSIAMAWSAWDAASRPIPAAAHSFMRLSPTHRAIWTATWRWSAG